MLLEQRQQHVPCNSLRQRRQCHQHTPAIDHSCPPDTLLLSGRPCPLLLLLLLLLSIVCVLPHSASAVGSRQQHNVWYNGLFISGIAVDEASGDVFFSDAAANRVVRQSSNGTVLVIYQPGFFSPMQLAYSNGVLYAADSTNNRVAVIDVASSGITFSSPSRHLKSASALAVNEGSGSVWVVDGYGLGVEVWSPGSDTWSQYVDMSAFSADQLPVYLSSITVQPYSDDSVSNAWLTDPVQQLLYQVCSGVATFPGQPATAYQWTAIQQYAGPSDLQLFLDWHWHDADGSDQAAEYVALIEADSGLPVNSWVRYRDANSQRLPFYGWALHVDARQAMYISDSSDATFDPVSTPFGRVIKMEPDGSVSGQWSMNDSSTYDFTSVWYDDDSTAGGSCAFWVTDRTRGLGRVAADGSALLPFYPPPVDQADELVAVLTGVASVSVDHDTLLVLDTSSSVSSKLWLFQPSSRRYSLLNTSAAQLSPAISGMTASATLQVIYLADSLNSSVVCLNPDGSQWLPFNSSAVGFVSPSGLEYRNGGDSALDELWVVDADWQHNGAVLVIDPLYAQLRYTIVANVSKPIGVVIDAASAAAYIAYEGGYVSQLDISSRPPYAQQAVHQPTPNANNIRSMTVSAAGYVYMLDAYSRRIIILLGESGGWIPGNDCIPPHLRASSSSSSSSTAVVPHLPSSSSSSTASQPGSDAGATLWPASAWMALVAVVGALAVCGGAAGLYYRYRTGHDRRSSRSRTGGWQEQADEQLMDAQQLGEHDMQEGMDEEVEEEEEEEDKQYEQAVCIASPAADATVSLTAAHVQTAADEAHEGGGALSRGPTTPGSTAVDDSAAVNDRAGRRYDYYVAQVSSVHTHTHSHMCYLLLHWRAFDVSLSGTICVFIAQYEVVAEAGVGSRASSSAPLPSHSSREQPTHLSLSIDVPSRPSPQSPSGSSKRSDSNHLSSSAAASSASALSSSTYSSHSKPSDPKRISPATASTATVASNSSNSSHSSNSDRSSNSSSSSSTSSTDYAINLFGTASFTDTAVSFPATSVAAIRSPSHIAELQSVWRTTPTFIDSVTDLTILGEGSSGVVYRGQYKGVACVVKLPKSVSLTGAGAAWREWQCHLLLPPHDSLVRFLGALPMAATNYLVLAFVRQGSLHALLTSPNPATRAWYSRPYGVMRCLLDMCAVLHHMHSNGVVHRDVSCRNILVDSDGRMVLADLGLAAQFASPNASPSLSPSAPSRSMSGAAVSAAAAVEDSQTAVPVRWTSPESLSSSRYDSKSDVWSLGVALWEMTAGGRLPYGQQQPSNTKACIRPIIARQYTLHVDDQWGSMDDSGSVAEWTLAGRVRQLIQLCLTHTADRRPDSTQLVRLVQQLWSGWRVEVGREQAEQLESEWVQYHSEVQQRLGAPEHGKLSALA